MDKPWADGPPLEDWWRFADVRYEYGCFTFRGGSPYLPKKMFDDYRQLHSQSEDIPIPYVTLNNALETLEPIAKKITRAIESCHMGNHIHITRLYTDKVLDPIVEWIRANGPLGILLHETRRIVQPAVWQLRGNAVSAAYPVDLWAAGEGWKRIWIPSGKTGRKEDIGRFTVADEDERGRGFYTDAESINSSSTETAEKLIKFIEGGHRGADYLEQFFPEHYAEISGTDIYPAPLSSRFFDLYREPVHLFLQGASALCHAIKDSLGDNEDRRAEGAKHLLHLAAPASFILKPGFRGGQYELSFSAPSLLSALAAWANADIVAEKAFLCKQCGKLHASPATKSLFCSDTCRQLHSKQKNRAKKKALTLKADGKSAVEIASKLKRDIEEVESWLVGSGASTRQK